jgi:hypothetical protein
MPKTAWLKPESGGAEILSQRDQTCLKAAACLFPCPQTAVKARLWQKIFEDDQTSNTGNQQETK